MEKFQVINKRNNQVEEAVIKDDGYISVNGRDLSKSTFERWYKRVEGEGSVIVTETKTEGGNTMNENEEVKHEGASDLAGSAEPTGTEGSGEQPAGTDAEKTEGAAAEGGEGNAQDPELQALLEGSKDVTPPAAPTPRKQNEQAAPAPVFNPVLLEGHTIGTKGGKCDKTFTSIGIVGKILDITEYNGFITDVRVSVIEGEGEAAEKKEVYKSPKMSLKDTLEHLGLDADQLKVARKEIVALRKQAKETFKAPAAAPAETAQPTEQPTA